MISADMEIASDSDSASELEESLKETTPRVRGSGAIEFLSEPDSCPELESSDDTWSSDSDIMSTINADAQCDSACLPVQLGKTKPGRPRAPLGSAADTPANARRRARAAERKREARLERDWRRAVAASDDTRAHELYLQLLPTVRGRKLFPSQTLANKEVKAMRKLAQNVRSLHSEMGVRSKHRKDMTARIVKGLPPAFTREVLGIKSSYLRQLKKREHDVSSCTVPSLISECRDDSKGRVRFSAEFRQLMTAFFMDNTVILSGADTETRRLLMNKGRLEAEFEVRYPSLLRKLATLDPAVRPDPESKANLTVLQMNILTAEAVADAEGFSEAEEYKQRLEVVLQR